MESPDGEDSDKAEMKKVVEVRMAARADVRNDRGGVNEGAVVPRGGLERSRHHRTLKPT